MESVDHVPWDGFLDRFTWKQGEHVSLIGSTGCGKSTVARALLPRRQFVTVLASKPRDTTLDALRRDGYQLARSWPPPRPRRPRLRPDGSLAERRVLLWPPMRTPSDVRRQRDVIGHALTEMFTEGGWCIYADELRYLAGTLGLKSQFELVWLQGRSIGLSLVSSTQRPAWVPREMYSQATHLFLWRSSDEADLRRLSDIGGDHGRSPKELRSIVAALPKHHALYLHADTGQLLTTQAHP